MQPDDAPALRVSTPARSDRMSRGLVLAFLLCLAFIGWLGATGISDAAASGHGLFAPSAGDCGGG